jgi:predicted RNase H-like nuclease
MRDTTAVFDDTRTKIIGDAFDAVFRKLHGTCYPDMVREAIADRVIQIALRSAERDPSRLADAVMASLRLKL